LRDLTAHTVYTRIAYAGLGVAFMHRSPTRTDLRAATMQTLLRRHAPDEV
jgi:hypothetical protein